MAASAFILSFVYYTFILALVEASRAVLYTTPTPFIPNNVDLTGLLASSALAALTLLALIFIVYGILRSMDWYADEYEEVLSGIVQRVPTRVVPVATLAISVIAFDIYSSSVDPLQSISRVIVSTFTLPTLLYFVAFGAAVIHRISVVLNVFRDVEHGTPHEEKQLLSNWERALVTQSDTPKRGL